MLTKLKHCIPAYILYSLYCALIEGIHVQNLFTEKKVTKVGHQNIISLKHNRSHTQNHCLMSQMFFFIHLNLTLACSCTSTKEICFLKAFSNYFIKHNKIYMYPTKMPKIKVSIEPKNVFRSIYTNSWTNSLDSKTKGHRRIANEQRHLSFKFKNRFSFKVDVLHNVSVIHIPIMSF